MIDMRRLTSILLLGIVPFAGFSQSITVDLNKNVHPISPLIYGNNGTNNNTGTNMTSSRLGGNRLTGYNWENNASNGGKDAANNSDNELVYSYSVPSLQINKPGAVFEQFRSTCRKNNQYNVITLQIAGYVAADKTGVVSATDIAPSSRWHYVKYKNGSFLGYPTINDDTVYMDECVNYLVTKFGTAADSGFNAFIIDNEPDIWHETHPLLHPKEVTCGELLSKSLKLSTSIKAIDSSAYVFGPTLSGWKGIYNLNAASDWSSYSATYNMFTEAYLDFFRQKSDSAGKRLLDVFNVNWYPQGRAGGYLVFGNTNDTISQALIDLRMQVTRSLWDTTYKEPSWIPSSYGQPIALIPLLKSQIDKYYPGTKLAFTEYQYGAYNHYSGGIAIADVLGIYGKNDVYISNIWESTAGYVASAFKLYRNYDGLKSTFGNTSVDAVCDNNVSLSAHASVDSLDKSIIHIIVLNKSSDPLTSTITLNGVSKINFKKVYGFSEMNKDILLYSQDKMDISGNSFSQVVNAHAAYHILVYTGSNLGPNVACDNLQVSKSIIYGKESATVTLTKVATGTVKLVIQDQNKKIVKTLDDKSFAAGSYTYTLSADSFSNGNYVVKAIYDTTTLVTPIAVRFNSISLSKNVISVGYTKLGVVIVKTGNIKITVINAKGVVAKTIVDKEMQAGTYNYDIWVDSVPAGVNTIKFESAINDAELTLTVNKSDTTSSSLIGDELNDKSVLVKCYPNPVKGNILNVSINSIRTSDFSVVLKTIVGKEVYRNVVSAGEKTIITIPTGELTPGVYFLSIGGESYHKTHKINIK